MGVPSVGSVVLVKFPYSDLAGYKLRPALVIARAEFDNVVLCQITSRAYSSKHAISIKANDFSEGKLPVDSFVRADKIFTADQKLIMASLGTLKQAALATIKSQLATLLDL